MRTKVTDLHPNRNWLSVIRSASYVGLGIIHLSQGTVIVNQIDKGDLCTQLEISYKGKLYTKEYLHWYSQRFCTTLAKRFMAEVIELSK